MTVWQIHRNRLVLFLATLPGALLALGAVAGAVIVGPALLFLLIHAVGVGLILPLLAWSSNPDPNEIERTVEVDEGALVLDGRRYPRSEMKSGHVLSHHWRWLVRIERRGARLPLELLVASDEDGQQLLHELGFTAAQTVATFRARSRLATSNLRLMGVVFSMMAACGVLAGFVGNVAPTLVPPFALLFFAVVGTLIAAPARVDVGADGILVRWLGSKRFISHADIEMVTSTLDNFASKKVLVRIVLRRGETYVLPIGNVRTHGKRAEALVARIRQAKAVHDAGEAVPTEAQLDRGERSYAEWIAALREGFRLGSHRDAALRPDKLWRIVENTAAEPAGRAAAAVALSGSFDASDRERLTRIANATAAPKLRVALDAIAAEREAQAIAEAIEELEARH